METWLCLAPLLYFETPPRRLYVRCDPLPAGVQPIWNPLPGEEGRRFVEAPRGVCISATTKETMNDATYYTAGSASRVDA